VIKNSRSFFYLLLCIFASCDASKTDICSENLPQFFRKSEKIRLKIGMKSFELDPSEREDWVEWSRTQINLIQDSFETVRLDKGKSADLVKSLHRAANALVIFQGEIYENPAPNVEVLQMEFDTAIGELKNIDLQYCR